LTEKHIEKFKLICETHLAQAENNKLSVGFYNDSRQEIHIKANLFPRNLMNALFIEVDKQNLTCFCTGEDDVGLIIVTND
jgi:hypothetical protein